MISSNVARRFISKLSAGFRHTVSDLTSAELRDPIRAVESCPEGYYRLKKRIDLYKHRCDVMGLGPGPYECEIAHAHELVYLGAICSEMGQHTLAARHLAMAQKLRNDIYETMRFMSLTRSASYFSDLFSNRYSADLEASSFLDHHCGTLASLLKKNRDSICVVGNSPCELGKGNGKRIDDHAVVVRFNNFSQQAEFAKDYGKKCDVWCRVPWYGETGRREGFKPSLTVTAQSLVWREVNGQDMVFEYLRKEEPLECTPIEIVSSLTTRCGAYPSSGIAVLSWIQSILGSLQGVGVYGFSLSDQINGTTHYFASRKRSALHDWLAEREVLDQMLKGNPERTA